MFASEKISYQDTGAFSAIVNAYVNNDPRLAEFFSEPVTIEGIRNTIAGKSKQNVNRATLVNVLNEQYAKIDADTKVRSNIALLSEESTFTVCTAHQPNLFTGPLFFLFKIIHAIKLCEELKKHFPGNHFVPVYYMGSEDADFAELNHTYIEGKRLEWKKEQTGAVGRMIVDKTLVDLINEIEGQLYAAPFAPELVAMLKSCYSAGKTIQEATFELVNILYGSYGLVVLIPDHPALKKQMLSVFRDDLLNHTPYNIAEATSKRLAENFHAQAYPRKINLFYLKDHYRERIEEDGEGFRVVDTDFRFSKEELLAELEQHPERFSPNVILRGLFQETILPNIVFVGGGGELAYWLQLKDLFDHYKVVFPVLVLRNSFLVVESKWKEKISKLDFDVKDFFRSEEVLAADYAKKHSDSKLELNGNLQAAVELFGEIEKQATAVDSTLSGFVLAIKARSVKQLESLEKKMIRAGKRKFSEQQEQIKKIRTSLFPNEGLQERRENFSSMYAKWGKQFIQQLLEHSPSLEQHFTILHEKV